MPKYSFICLKCGLVKQQYVSAKIKEMKCEMVDCDAVMQRQLPTLCGRSDITEIVNQYTGKTAKQDQTEMLRERRAKYYWSVEVPRFVASGVYNMDSMLENGWVWFDDNEHMHVHTKPPHER